MIVIYKNELYHHGIEGQKWGVRNGPPYPLDRNTNKRATETISKARKYAERASKRMALATYREHRHGRNTIRNNNGEVVALKLSNAYKKAYERSMRDVGRANVGLYVVDRMLNNHGLNDAEIGAFNNDNNVSEIVNMMNAVRNDASYWRELGRYHENGFSNANNWGRDMNIRQELEADRNYSGR